ncbi:MAG: hypothetical protein WD556_08040 [Actinomycetota bacterium]
MLALRPWVMTVLVGLTALVLLVPGTASASVFDDDDVQSPLDIRFVDVDLLDHGKTRFTLMFHDRVPPWMLRKRGALVELDEPECCRFFVRFKTTRTGVLRTSFGDYGSSIYHSPANHPNPFTYQAVLKAWFMNSQCCKPDVYRGRTTRTFRRGGPTIDRTRWVPV